MPLVARREIVIVAFLPTSRFHIRRFHTPSENSDVEMSMSRRIATSSILSYTPYLDMQIRIVCLRLATVRQLDRHRSVRRRCASRLCHRSASIGSLGGGEKLDERTSALRALRNPLTPSIASGGGHRKRERGRGREGEKSLIITLYYVGHRSCERIVDPPLLFFALVPHDRSL